MSEPLTPEERRTILDAEVLVSQLPDGWYRLEKAGFVGVGSTMREASMDLAAKYTAATRPAKSGEI